MYSIQQTLLNARQTLRSHSDNPYHEALLLLQFASGKSKEFLLAHADETLQPSACELFQKSVSRRLTGEPIAYITQTKEFWSLPLEISPGVLIPRPETELIVETTLALAREKSNISILDLGTGSGCIALALAKELPEANIVACDHSPASVLLAQKNARKLNLDNVRIIQSDWFKQVTQPFFDIIVSNPPYISEQDSELEHSVRQFEPASALFAENNGLASLYHIIRQARQRLHGGGTLVLEHGYRQAQAVHRCLRECHYQHIDTLQDIQQLDRVTRGSTPSHLNAR